MVGILEENFVLHRSTCPYISTLNVMVDSRHRRVVERILALPFQSKVPNLFWPYTFRTIGFLVNNLLSKNLKGHSPYELLYKK